MERAHEERGRYALRMLLHALLAGVKVARALDGIQDEQAYERMFAEERSMRALDEGGMLEAQSELDGACNGLSRCALVVVGAEPGSVELDGVKADAGKDGNGKPLAILSLCAGRHHIVVPSADGAARTSGPPGGAYRGSHAPAPTPFWPHPFTIFEGEVLALRVTPTGWTRDSAVPSAELSRMLDAGEVSRADYFQQIARVRITAGAAQPRRQVMDRVRVGIDSILGKVAAGVLPEALRTQVSQVSAALVGVPLPRSFSDELVRIIGYQAWEIRAAGHPDRAELACHLGLALLPEDPSLSTLLASLLVAREHIDEARAYLDTAEARGRGLTDSARTLFQTTRAQCGSTSASDVR
jgi:hypothetical protein